MYRLIATDLDGTLLNAHHQVDPFTIDVLRKLERQGVAIAIATGRHYSDVAGIRDVLGVRAHLITSNGARVHDPDDREIFAENIRPEFVRRLVSHDVADDAIVNLFLDRDWLIDRDAPELLRYHQDSGFRYAVTDLRAYPGHDVAKVLYIAEPETLARVETNLEREFADELYVTYSLADCLEVMSPVVSKGRALQVVLDRLGITRADCVAFGDNMNDIDMLETAGRPFMMGNSNPDLIARLPHVPRIGNNFDAAVARQLTQLFDLENLQDDAPVA
ncbi:Cof-type HAD-IIB family hydrolase [Pararobbsia silviterrae]|uniref:Cof-type HAD-IIB family hydrolase n=1 Tax=Pararobbsia silviterrae TaxID=1792498 RepID=A0A494Y9P3_9BURK|nr:Cof-type HAD-IIB family hydrolase [Pararobbsia silviterrae]RKP58400.1 Cof-type HAD-IIB family hydrolase [Pararobbsia silviterrae]